MTSCPPLQTFESHEQIEGTDISTSHSYSQKWPGCINILDKLVDVIGHPKLTRGPVGHAENIIFESYYNPQSTVVGRNWCLEAETQPSCSDGNCPSEMDEPRQYPK